jgi:hypothetical protein
MEVLVRSACDCIEPRWACPFCNGEGTLEAWLPITVLPLLRQESYILMGHRQTRSSLVAK